ncbi:MAG: hypothetical protein RSD44_08365, partial [Akkermansia sp.]
PLKSIFQTVAAEAEEIIPKQEIIDSVYNNVFIYMMFTEQFQKISDLETDVNNITFLFLLIENHEKVDF